jgi:hypothetical protein
MQRALLSALADLRQSRHVGGDGATRDGTLDDRRRSNAAMADNVSTQAR